MLINAFSEFCSNSLANRGCSVILLDTLVQGVRSRNFQLYPHQKITGNLLLLALQIGLQVVTSDCLSVLCGHQWPCVGMALAALWWSAEALAMMTHSSVTLGTGETMKGYFNFFLFSSMSVNCPNAFFFAEVTYLARAGPWECFLEDCWKLRHLKYTLGTI